jgi:hypothetical protein
LGSVQRNNKSWDSPSVSFRDSTDKHFANSGLTQVLYKWGDLIHAILMRLVPLWFPFYRRQNEGMEVLNTFFKATYLLSNRIRVQVLIVDGLLTYSATSRICMQLAVSESHPVSGNKPMDGLLSHCREIRTA